MTTTSEPEHDYLSTASYPYYDLVAITPQDQIEPGDEDDWRIAFKTPTGSYEFPYDATCYTAKAVTEHFRERETWMKQNEEESRARVVKLKTRAPPDKP